MMNLDLTQSQKLIWTGQMLNPNASLYNMAIAFELNGVIDISHFKAAFEALIAKSDALRIKIDTVKNVPVQSVREQHGHSLEIIDWSEETDPTAHYQPWVKARSKKTFDISQCMFDAVLIKLSENKFIWYFNQHHLITDGWSVTVVYKKMVELYKASVNGNLTEVAALPSFIDYVQHEQKARIEAVNQSHWQNKAENLPPAPRLYGYKHQTTHSDSRRYLLDLGKERSEKLRSLTSEIDLRAWTQHMSLFNIFATTLFAYLHRVSGQKKLAIGTPAHNRVTAAFKNTTGLFIELFPLMAAVQDEETFISLFKKIQLEANEFLRYGTSGAATPALSRGFNVVLNYINATFTDFNGIPMTSDWVHPDHADAGHALRLQVHDFDDSGSIKLHFDLNTHAFPETIREDIPGHFLVMLDAFIADRSQPLGQPGLIKFPQRIHEKGESETDHNVVSLFEEQAQVNRESIAIVCEGSQLKFGELNRKANQLARWLQSRGVEKGAHVVIHLPRSVDFIIAVLGVLKAGGVYIPIDTTSSSARTQEMVDDAAPILLLSSTELVKNFNGQTSEKSIALDDHNTEIERLEESNLKVTIEPEDLAYILYTSGSTGRPKGVMIAHESLSHYIQWGRQSYGIDQNSSIPLFTSIGFDLTVTSIFLPLISGGTSIIYTEAADGPDLAIFDVIKENKATFIKLTPSHLALINAEEFSNSDLNTMILGGEDLKYELVKPIHDHSQGSIRIINEYGPTEVTVGCIVSEFDPNKHAGPSVPIGIPIPSIQALVLDDFLNPVPYGVAGELYLGGIGLAKGYLNQPTLTQDYFTPSPLIHDTLVYRTGDLVRQEPNGVFHYLGRKDEQVKINGRRVELAEIEGAISQIQDIEQCVVELRGRIKYHHSDDVTNCTRCGLPSNYPNITFDEEHVCSLCRSYESYRERVKKYFKTFDDFKEMFSALPKHERTYDCIVLLSGGKDSTYTLAKVVDMGMKVLAFTLDNGYISEQAKDNIRRVVNDLGVDHIFGKTPAMNDIFVDSLKTHCNVCDGCFKTIYTLSMKVALEKQIPYIVTGLSRGQFFETRLTEELFTNENLNIDDIDKVILNIRKTYHRVDDAVKRLLDVSAFEDDTVFDQVRFLDFYRYTDVSLDEMLEFLDQKLSWQRPTDTGRSTNCLINQAGIYVHKKERGYSNYAFPYSWDVRLGHKTREASLDEINEVIDEEEVNVMLDEIGYTAEKSLDDDQQLIAYYTSKGKLDEIEIRRHLETLLPAYMIPVQYVGMDTLPLSQNGKIDRQALPVPDAVRPVTEEGYVAPRSDIEEMLAEIWSEVLNIDKIGVFDKFIDLGGSSLAAIRIISRANEAFELELPMNITFSKPTIAAFAAYIRETITKLLEEMDAD